MVSKLRLNLGKATFFSAMLLAVSGIADPFVVIDDSANPQESDRQAVIANLKMRAVTEWLQTYLGPKFGQYQKLVTPELVEKHIPTYHVGRAPGNRTQIEGELDTQGLRGWVNLLETRGNDANSLKAALVVSSKLPGTPFSAEETGLRNREQPIVQVTQQLLGASLGKMNLALALPRGSISLGERPKSESDIRFLAGQQALAGMNGLVWVQLQPCKECGGARADFVLFNLPQNRLTLAQSFDLGLDPNAPVSGEKLRTLLRQPVDEFRSQLETLLASGSFFSNVYRLRVEGIPAAADGKTYRVPKQTEVVLTRADFLQGAATKGFAPNTVEFEIFSRLAVAEIGPKVETLAFPGFRLKTTGVESQTVIMRYLK